MKHSLWPGPSIDRLILQHVIASFIASLCLKKPLGWPAKMDLSNHQRIYGLHTKTIAWSYRQDSSNSSMWLKTWNIHITHTTMTKIKSTSIYWVHFCKVLTKCLCFLLNNPRQLDVMTEDLINLGEHFVCTMNLSVLIASRKIVIVASWPEPPGVLVACLVEQANW